MARPYVSQMVESRSIVRGLASGPGAGREGAGEELPADPVELADVTPAEAAQEGAQGGGGLQAEAEDPLGAAGPQRVRIVDAVAAGKRGHDKRQELVADIRPTGPGAEVEVFVDEGLEAEMGGQGGRQEEPGVGHQAVVIKGCVEPVEAVRRSHQSGAPLGGSMGRLQRHLPSSDGHLIRRLRAAQPRLTGGSGLSGQACTALLVMGQSRLA